MKWFTLDWYKYLFEKPHKKGWLYYLEEADISFIELIKCRINQHKQGPTFYNPGGLEPDWSCRNCGEDLG